MVVLLFLRPERPAAASVPSRPGGGKNWFREIAAKRT